jgi:molybdopterin/thiamine biosynthesis adenylyltransferase
VTDRFELRLSRSLYDAVDDDLRSGPRDADELEQAGFVLCGAAQLPDRILLLCRAWRPIPLDRRIRRRGYGLAWTAEFNAEILDEADELHAVPVLVHRHESRRDAALSRLDRRAGDPLLAQMSTLAERQLVGSVVLHESTATGLLWDQSGIAASLLRVRIAGAPITDLYPGRQAPVPARPRLQRQTLAIGPESDAKLAATTVAIVGLSGGGSHVVQQVAHAGVGGMILVDDDVVDETNRGRVVGTRHDDDGRLKTDAMRRLVEGIDPAIDIHTVPRRSSDPEGLAILRGADVIVACVDRFDVRAEINSIARRYLIPYIDVGMTLDSRREVLVSASGQAILTLPGAPCLRCTPLLSDVVLEHERLVAPPGYDRNPNAPGQAQVVSMNGLLSSQAVTLVLAIITGYIPGDRIATGGWWQYDALEGQLDFSSLAFPQPACPGCAEEGHGDPWFALREVSGEQTGE